MTATAILQDLEQHDVQQKEEAQQRFSAAAGGSLSDESQHLDAGS